MTGKHWTEKTDLFDMYSLNHNIAKPRLERLIVFAVIIQMNKPVWS